MKDVWETIVKNPLCYTQGSRCSNNKNKLINAGIYMYGYHLFILNIPLGKGVLDCDYP